LSLDDPIWSPNTFSKNRDRHVLLDNRYGLVANVGATAATGTAERWIGC